MTATIRPKTRNAIISALQAGVVPTQGLQHIQVGRVAEVKALVSTIEAIADGGSGFRIVSGEYGAGKTFFLHLVRNVALEHKLVTVHADLSPERKLVSSNGQARNLYSELVSNIATRSRKEGGALGAIVDRFTQDALKESESTGRSTDEIISGRLEPLHDMVAGWDFSTVMKAYCKAHLEGNEVVKSNALRWLKGEYTTRMEARQDLGVRTFIDDKMVYDALKLMGRFCKLAGHAGFMIVIDECVNLYKIPNSTSRTSNYEIILRMLNDCLQGEQSTSNIGICLGFTPESINDSRRGLYSYEALQSRLNTNSFAQQKGLVDYNQPILQLKNLSAEELFILLRNIREVFRVGVDHLNVPDEAISAYMNHCNAKVGAAYFQTPRESIRGYMNLLSLLEQYPEKHWKEFIEAVEPKSEATPEERSQDGDSLSGLASFTL